MNSRLPNPNIIPFIFCVLILFVHVSLSMASPASPHSIEIIQPDGSRFKGKIHGDEFQKWTEAEASGHTILHNRDSGYWEYAEKQPDGLLRHSGVKVDPSGLYAPKFIPKGVKPDRDYASEKKHKDSARRKYHVRLVPPSFSSSIPSGSSTSPDAVQAYATSSATSTSPAPGDWVPIPESGSKKVLLILVSFTDRAIQTSPSDWYTSLFSTTPGVRSVANFYRDNSFGALAITPVAHTQPGNPAGVVNVSINRSHPYNYPDTWSNEQAWITAALDAASLYIDFNTLDANGDGLIETSEAVVYFIVAGYEESGSNRTPNVWAHAWVDASGAGKQFPDYAINGELNDSGIKHPIGIIVHELGHQLLGLPDLYDTSNINAGMGNFSVMAGGCWGLASGQYYGATPVSLDAWSREYLGWTTPAIPIVTGSYSLGASLAASDSTFKLIKPSFSTTEYWLVENRNPTGWDEGITGLVSGYSGGLFITHIEITAGTVGNNDINQYTAGPHQGVVPEQANTTDCNMLTSSCRGALTTTFYTGNNSAFGASTNPAALYYSGTSSDIGLKNISVRGANMTFDIEITVTLPVISEFVVPSLSTSLDVPISTFSASGAKPINGYLVTESSSPPSVSDTDWSGTKPANYRFASSGSKTLYAWAKDEGNNISVPRTAAVQVNYAPTSSTQTAIQAAASLQATYNSADSSAVIRAGAKVYTENLTLNRQISVTLDGGFDDGYQNKAGLTLLAGSLTIAQGTTVIGDLIIW